MAVLELPVYLAHPGDAFSKLFLHVLVLLYLEIVLANTADGAYPIIWDVFKSCSGRDAVIWVSLGGVINIATNCANVLLHNVMCLLVNNLLPKAADFLLEILQRQSYYISLRKPHVAAEI